MGDKTPTSADGRRYIETRGIYRLTQQCVQVATLVVSRTPLSPVNEVQSIQMRVGFNGAIREAVALGRWLERAKNGAVEPEPFPRTRPKAQTVIVDPKYLAEVDPGFDEDSTTDVIVRKKSFAQRLRSILGL